MANKSVIVPKGKYLSDVIQTLPSGLLVKDATGMGATTLELRAKRNSIICEPLRSIIESKLSTGVFSYYAPVSFQQLEDYVKSKPAFLKILVTSERVGILIRDLERLGFNVSQTFFLLIDEIDLHQTQSDFRPYLAQALDHYKRFPPEKRAMVTATPYQFSDPALNAESIVYLSSESVQKRNIEVVLTSDHVAATVTMLQELEGQCFIFVNSIDSILEIADRAGLKKEDVAAYCGVSAENKERLGDYYQPFTPTPGHRFNFYTSAYYSGCDLLVSGNLITVSNPNNPTLRLHPAQIIQIAGRLRKGIKRDIIISGLANSVFIDEQFKAKLWDKAQTQHNNFNWLLTEAGVSGKMQFALESLRRFENDEESLVRQSTFNSLEYNYSYIDYQIIVENAKVTLYQGQDSLTNFIKSLGNNVISYNEIALQGYSFSGKSSTRPTKEVAFERANKIIIEIMVEVIMSRNVVDFADLIRKRSIKLPEAERIRLEKYLDLYHIQETDAFDELEGDPKAIAGHIFGLEFKELPKDSPLKKLVHEYFEIGETYPTEHIEAAMKAISLKFGLEDVTSTNKATRLLGTFFEIKHVNLPKDQSGTREKGYKIMGYINSLRKPDPDYSDEEV